MEINEFNQIFSDPISYPLPPKYIDMMPGVIKKKDSMAGDIVIADDSGDMQIVKLGEYTENKGLYNKKGYAPIAVVVVPASHTEDGTARCMSLKYMSLSNPEGGSDTSVNIYWGYNDATVPGNTVISGFEYTIPGTTSTGTGNWYLPSDSDKWNVDDVDDLSNTDPIARKKRQTFSGGFVISPYGEDGISQNEAYFKANAIGQYMDGRGETEHIVANAANTDWKTAATIENAYNKVGVYPAAFTCQRYHTVGTSAGDWYLPSCGELVYIIPRAKEIREGLLEAGAPDVNNGVHDATYNRWMWTSTEFSSSNAWGVGSYGGTVDYYGSKSRYGSVVSFIAI